ncbi:hypothetical protein WI643_28550, partial [Salmonella enterica subsp. enterica serovar Corvallis]
GKRRALSGEVWFQAYLRAYGRTGKVPGLGELDSHTRRPWIINDNFAHNLSDNEVNVPTTR